MPKDTFINLPEEKQEKIMRSAISEFLANGYEKGNIGSIARAAGVAKGSMYQYFENKKELFLDAVRWAIGFIWRKYNATVQTQSSTIDLFDYILQSSKQTWSQMREERELVIFVQDVFLGKYSSLTDESMACMMKAADEQVLRLIEDGQQNGSIRRDIDKQILALFFTGASIKIKEFLMNRARNLGEDLIDEDFEVNETIFKDLIELLKNGMGAK